MEYHQLPTKEQQERVLNDRPGDGLYPQAEKDITKVINAMGTYKQQIENIILQDMTIDLAIADALDHVSTVLNYLPQDKDMEVPNPEFRGDRLMANFNRITELKLSLSYTEILKMTDEQQAAVLQAEITRLWGGSNPQSQLIKKILSDQAKKTNTHHPQQQQQEVYKKNTAPSKE